MNPYVLVIHGGAGTLRRADITADQVAVYEAVLRESLAAGQALLAQGNSALDAVEAAVRVMEDSPLFNAGHGAVFTHEGRVELDAALMDGSTRDAGALCHVTRVRNPISLARLVLERSEHVLLAGEGAEAFAQAQGVELVDPAYFHTERRWQDLQRAKAKDTMALSEDTSAAATDRKFGTVGAVALDRHGHLAAATSTGGMTNKRWGRVGDAPLIGSGTYADDATCAVSCTGHGEFFIRAGVAFDVAARMRYLGEGLVAAADAVVHGGLLELGGRGGLVAVDASGAVSLAFNTEGMYRGVVREGEVAEVAIFK